MARTHSSTFDDHHHHGPIGLGVSKGWASERIPLSGNRARRHVAASALMPFSSGRALPSKWDDAERWISSPVSVGNGPSSSIRSTTTSSYYNSQRRVKSRSGPLGPNGLVCYGSFGYSPVLGMGVINNAGNWRNSMSMEETQHGLVGDEVGRKSYGGGADNLGPDWPDLWSDPPSSPTFQGEDENIDDIENYNCIGESVVERVVSRRDMATQMFPESDISSTTQSSLSSNIYSPTCSNSCPKSPNLRQDESLESKVRDVQIDKQTSTTRRSTPDRDEFNYPPSNESNSAINEIIKAMPKLQNEEAKIIAWENLQRAKAEAAMHKLEVTLEKRRSSSMEKIEEKLRKAEIKAQKMRSSVSKDKEEHKQRTLSKLPSFCRKIRLGSLAKSYTSCYSLK